MKQSVPCLLEEQGLDQKKPFNFKLKAAQTVYELDRRVESRLRGSHPCAPKPHSQEETLALFWGWTGHGNDVLKALSRKDGPPRIGTRERPVQ